MGVTNHLPSGMILQVSSQYMELCSPLFKWSKKTFSTPYLKLVYPDIIGFIYPSYPPRSGVISPVFFGGTNGPQVTYEEGAQFARDHGRMAAPHVDPGCLAVFF